MLFPAALSAFFVAFFSFLFPITQSASAKSLSCQLVHQDSLSKVRKCHGVNVVQLRGHPLDRAQKMGELLRGPLSSEVVDYFSHKVTGLFREEAGGAGILLGLAYNQMVRLMHREMPTNLAEEVDAMANGLRLDPIILRRGLSLPDTGVLLQGLGSLPFLKFLPAGGCSSVALRGKEGGLLWGRNLDFAGVGTFDRHPMLLSIEPAADTKELRHIVLGADGLLFGGITGVNEAGIAFAVHQNFSKDVSLSGIPMVVIGELVLRKAHNLEEAEEILRAHRPASIWTFVVGDLNQGEMMAVESSPQQFLVRRNDGPLFAQTNHQMHEESRRNENADEGILANSVHRMKKAFEILESEKNPGPATVAKALSYQENKLGYFSSFHDILKAETIQSVIFESRPLEEGSRPEGNLYLSVDEAPSSGGKYAQFNLSDFFRAGSFESEFPSPGLVDLAGTPLDKRVRQRELAQAYHTFFDLRRPLEAAAILESHPTLSSALFRAFALYRSGRYEEALAQAESAARNPRFLTEPAYLLESLEIIRLSALLRLHRKSEAHELAERLLSRSLVKNFTRNLAGMVAKGKDPPSWMLRLNFNFFSGDIGGRKD